MSDTNITKGLDTVHIGPAVLKFYDEVNDWLVDLGKVDNIMLRKTVDKAYMTSVYNGVAVQEKGQSISETWELSGKFGETLDPNTQYLTFKNCGTPTVNNNCQIIQVTENIQVFAGRCRVLTYNKGFYGTVMLPPPGGVTADNLDDPAATSPFVVGEHGVRVIAEYDGGGYSAPVQGTVTMLATDTMLVTITPPTSGAIPLFYRIYVYVPANGGYQLWARTPSTVVVFLAPVTGGETIPATGSTSFTVTNEAGDTTYVLDTDYTIDTTCGGLCILPDGDICDGQWIVVTYSYTADPMVTMSLGPSDRIPKYAHPVIIAMKSDSRITPAARGVEIHLWKTDFDFGFEWDLSSLNYESGFSFSVPVLFSESDLNFGEVSTLSDHYECYGLKDLRALTQYSKAANCESEVT